MSIQFTYNQEQAVKAGNSNFISETGAYKCTILEAKYTKSTSGALALEFSVETDDEMKGNYISVFYQAKNGETLQGGHNMIQAIMGCTRVKQLSRVLKDGKDIAPELTGKKVGLFLQKRLYTKGDGSDGYQFQIVCPFGYETGKTLAEYIENRPAERIDYLIAHTADKDDRNRQAPQPQQNPYQAQNEFYGQPSSANSGNFDDSIPF
ncbi:Uncharacterised protein [Phocoenobacter uteri]|uniref:DUF669 domain-containing protein n=2 Tax=Phocoenobacter uteri TaxID=146806 RepID=A0A379CA12_9PAST|nr:hypothetical protein [Phocoenobacter uteri]MDG6880980.1 hypothetical protein [Phocoenobacter uteri]SUB58999.1 Uncharacterised protein [Phocoenobacter uteri]